MSRKTKKGQTSIAVIEAIGINPTSVARAAVSEGRSVLGGPTLKLSGPKWEVAGICALLVLLVFSVFGQTIGFAFVDYDDGPNVYGNAIVSRGLSPEGIRWAFTNSQIGHWDPLTTLSHMVDCQLYGLWAGGHHLTNVLLHAASAVLLFVLLLQMTGALWRSAFVAAVWSIHPLRVESVAWVTERKDVLSGLFFMLTLLAYLTYACHPKSALRYLAVVVFLILGLMSKSMLMTLPFVLLLLDYWPLQRWRPAQSAASWRTAWQLVVEKIPLLLIAIIFALAAIEADREEMPRLEKVPVTQRIGEGLATYVTYMEQTVWPVNLVAVYVRLTGESAAAQLILAVAVLAVVSALVIWRWKEHPWLVIGWLWYLGMLAPVAISFSQVDRYTYLPQIGLLIAGTWAVAQWSERWSCRRMLLGSTAAVILPVLATAAFWQTNYWWNSEALWTHTLACTKDNSIAHYDYGCGLIQTGRIADAITQFRKALEINPAYAEAHRNLGNALLQVHRTDEAIAQYLVALQIDPSLADVHVNMGNILCQEGRFDSAVAQYTAALQTNPALADAHNGLGNIFLEQGKLDDAIAQYRAALQSDPSNAAAHNNLGYALFQQGRTEDAIAEYRAALQLNPGFASAQANLRDALYKSRQ